RTLRQQNREPAPPFAAFAFRPGRAHQTPQPSGSRSLDRIHADWLRFRIGIRALSSPAFRLSQDLLESLAAALRTARQAAPGKRISPRFDHDTAGTNFRQESLLRAVCFAGGGGKVYERRARLFQNAALRGRPPSRSEISRLRLFRNEDVFGALLSRLHRRRIPRRSGAGRGFSRFARRIAEAADGGGARRRLGENGVRGGRRHSCAARQTYSRVAATAGVRPPD